jgi:hypothetical protein
MELWAKVPSVLEVFVLKMENPTALSQKYSRAKK